MDPFDKSTDFLEAFRAGRADALAAVYKCFVLPVRNFILRGFSFDSGGRALYFRGGDGAEDVDDILQETFRRAFGPRARAAYDGVRPYKNYLFTIARNTVITNLAARQRMVPIGDLLTRDAPGEDLSPLERFIVAERMSDGANAPMSCAEASVENLEIYALVTGFVEHLDDVDRTFFLARFLGKLSQESTARHMGWNRARVRKEEARLRTTFLTHMRGSGYLEAREETRRVRRVEDRMLFTRRRERARDIWRTHRAESLPEFVHDAA